MEFNIALPHSADNTNAGKDWQGMKQRLALHLQENANTGHHPNNSYMGSTMSGMNSTPPPCTSFLAQVAGLQVAAVVAECRMTPREAARFEHALYLLEDRCVPFLLILYNRYRFFTCRQKDASASETFTSEGPSALVPATTQTVNHTVTPLPTPTVNHVATPLPTTPAVSHQFSKTSTHQHLDFPEYSSVANIPFTVCHDCNPNNGNNFLPQSSSSIPSNRPCHVCYYLKGNEGLDLQFDRPASSHIPTTSHPSPLNSFTETNRSTNYSQLYNENAHTSHLSDDVFPNFRDIPYYEAPDTRWDENADLTSFLTNQSPGNDSFLAEDIVEGNNYNYDSNFDNSFDTSIGFSFQELPFDHNSRTNSVKTYNHSRPFLSSATYNSYEMDTSTNDGFSYSYNSMYDSQNYENISTSTLSGHNYNHNTAATPIVNKTIPNQTSTSQVTDDSLKLPQTFDGFLSELQMWILGCEFGDLRDILLKDCIIMGIKDKTARYTLLRTEGLDLNKALIICRAVERLRKCKNASVETNVTDSFDKSVITDCNMSSYKDQLVVSGCENVKFNYRQNMKNLEEFSKSVKEQIRVHTKPKLIEKCVDTADLSVTKTTKDVCCGPDVNSKSPYHSKPKIIDKYVDTADLNVNNLTKDICCGPDNVSQKLPVCKDVGVSAGLIISKDIGVETDLIFHRDIAVGDDVSIEDIADTEYYNDNVTLTEYEIQKGDLFCTDTYNGGKELESSSKTSTTQSNSLLTQSNGTLKLKIENAKLKVLNKNQLHSFKWGDSADIYSYQERSQNVPEMLTDQLKLSPLSAVLVEEDSARSASYERNELGADQHENINSINNSLKEKIEKGNESTDLVNGINELSRDVPGCYDRLPGRSNNKRLPLEDFQDLSDDTEVTGKCKPALNILERKKDIKDDSEPIATSIKFMCSLCCAQFVNFTLLQKHLHDHVVGKIYQCRVCGSQFRKKSTLKQHKLKHNMKKVFIHQIKDKEYTHSQQSRSSTLVKGSSKAEIGLKANRTLLDGLDSTVSSELTLTEHKDTCQTPSPSTSEPPFQCFVQRKSLESKPCYSERSVRESERLISKTNCDTHMQSETDIQGKCTERPFICETCGVMFKRAYHLHEHRKLHSGDRPYACDECGAKFSESSKLKAHLRKHSGERPYLCQICGASFSWSAALKRHDRTHSLEKPLECSVCKKKFADHSTLTRHMRMHTGERPFPCTQCAQTFSDSSSVRRHMKTHTGEKPFTCEVCGARFAARGNLARHVKLHRGEKSHTCQVCGAKFVDSSKLKRHSKVHAVT